MLLSLRTDGLDSLLKEVRVFKELLFINYEFRCVTNTLELHWPALSQLSTVMNQATSTTSMSDQRCIVNAPCRSLNSLCGGHELLPLYTFPRHTTWPRERRVKTWGLGNGPQIAPSKSEFGGLPEFVPFPPEVVHFTEGERGQKSTTC